MSRVVAQGDSGGPLVNQSTGTVVGVTSGYQSSTGIDVFGDVPGVAGRIAGWVGAWTERPACGATPSEQVRGGTSAGPSQHRGVGPRR